MTCVVYTLHIKMLWIQYIIYKSFNQGPAGVLAEECWYLWECDKVLAPDVEREDSFKDEPGSTILRLQSYLVRKASHLTPRVVIFI